MELFIFLLTVSYLLVLTLIVARLGRACDMHGKKIKRIHEAMHEFDKSVDSIYEKMDVVKKECLEEAASEKKVVLSKNLKDALDKTNKTCAEVKAKYDEIILKLNGEGEA